MYIENVQYSLDLYVTDKREKKFRNFTASCRFHEFKYHDSNWIM